MPCSISEISTYLHKYKTEQKYKRLTPATPLSKQILHLHFLTLSCKLKSVMLNGAFDS